MSGGSGNKASMKNSKAGHHRGVAAAGGGVGSESSGARRSRVHLDLSGEMEEALKRLQDSKNVLGLVVMNAEGMPLKSSLDSTLTVQYSDLIKQLSITAKSTVRALDPSNELDYLRVRSRKHEIMIAPDEDYTLFIIQNPPEG